jgi:hypothetical protein
MDDAKNKSENFQKNFSPLFGPGRWMDLPGFLFTNFSLPFSTSLHKVNLEALDLKGRLAEKYSEENTHHRHRL